MSESAAQDWLVRIIGAVAAGTVLGLLVAIIQDWLGRK